MMERVTEFGVEVSDNGDVWTLVAPTPLFDALRVGVRNEDGSVTVDHGDGTGTRTTFHADGTVDTVEQLTGLPIPPPPEPDPMADMQAQLAAQQALIDELLAALGGGGNG